MDTTQFRHLKIKLIPRLQYGGSELSTCTLRKDTVFNSDLINVHILK
jgi:hypothetical protein